MLHHHSLLGLEHHPPRGRAGYSQRGAPLGPPRNGRGVSCTTAEAVVPVDLNRGGNVGGKRKADGVQTNLIPSASDQQPTELGFPPIASTAASARW